MSSKLVGKHQGPTVNRRNAKSTLSLHTQKKLKKLLFTIAKQEQQIELQRQFLASNENVEPYSLFQRLDRNEDSFVTSVDLLNFLRDNGIHNITEADCYYVVKFFDSDVDGRLNYPDFMQMILPCDNPELRAVATQRPNVYISKFDYLTLDVERDFTKLIMSEIDLHRKSEKIRQHLESALDYSEEAVYAAVDDWGYGFVDARNLKSFFRNNKYKATDEDCIAIIRRLDLDADSKLTKEEFLNGLKAQEPYSKMIVREQIAKKEELMRIKKQNQVDVQKGKRVNKKAEEGPLENAVQAQALDRNYKEVLSTSPLKKRVQLDLYGDPKLYDKSQSPNKSIMMSRNNNIGSPNKSASKSAIKNGQSPMPLTQSINVFQASKGQKSMMKSTNGFDQTAASQSPNKLKSSSATNTFKTPNSKPNANGKSGLFDSNTDFGTMFGSGYGNNQDTQSKLQQQSSAMDTFNTTQLEVNMVNMFREQLELEKRLERVKIDLTLRTDFNLIDAFRVFDAEGKGWITPQEVKEGLSQFGVFANLDDLNLYFSRYDKDEDGRLRYSEFCDSFLPTDAFHASLLAKKAPLHMHHMQQLQRDKVFYPETREIFITCWNIHLQNESEAEKLRLQISSKYGFNAYQCFQVIDSKCDGVIDKEEIKELLIKYNLYVSEKEICALIDRYDRKRDGRITYSEFSHEINPKTLQNMNNQQQ